MRISKSEGAETLRLSQFVVTKDGVLVNEINIEVEYQTSTFAVAAMLKGLNEFYFKPAGMQGDGAAIAQSEENLKVWEDLTKKAQSRIIMP